MYTLKWYELQSMQYVVVHCNNYIKMKMHHYEICLIHVWIYQLNIFYLDFITIVKILNVKTCNYNLNTFHFYTCKS
jgi:hypothetical protein